MDLFPFGGQLGVCSLCLKISIYLHLVQGLNQSDLPAYLLVEIHHLATARDTFPIKFITSLVGPDQVEEKN